MGCWEGVQGLEPVRVYVTAQSKRREVDDIHLAGNSVKILSHSWYHQRHHTADGFQNIWEPSRQASAVRAVGWVLSHAFASKENVPPAVRAVDPETLAAPPERLRLTWLGHAAALIQLPGLTLLTDPVFSRRASPFSLVGPERLVPSPLGPVDLPALDAVLLSHDHYDHLDEASIRALARSFDPLFVVPLGVGALVRGWGARRVLELDWWQYVDLAEWRLHGTPAKHFSGRGLTGRNATLWAGWFLEPRGEGPSLYFAGDSGYAGLFTEIGERLGPPEVALLPIGAYRPRWLMEPVHVEPEEAVQAFRDLGARHFIPIHWGTFDLAEEPVHEPPQRLRACAAAHGLTDRVHLLDVGGTFALHTQRASADG